MREPKISVVVPVYNVEKYVENCIKSLINQSYNRLEILLVDDGSTDKSPSICDKYKLVDHRIKVFHKCNEGLGITRNFGLKNSTGDFISFIDSDDYVSKNFYKDMVESIKIHKSDTCYGNIKLDIDGLIKQNDKIPYINNESSSIELLKSIFNIKTAENKSVFMGFSACRCLYNKKIIDEAKIKFESEREYISEDLLFNIEYLKRAKKISYSPNSYYYYRHNINSLTRKYRPDRYKEACKLIVKVEDTLLKLGIYNELKNGVSPIFMSYVRAAIKHEIQNNPKGFNEYYKNVKAITSDYKIKKYLLNIKEERVTQYIINFFIRNRCNLILIIVYKLMNR